MLTVRFAKPNEINLCRQKMAAEYKKTFNMTLQDGKADLKNRVEPYPDEYILCTIENKIVAVQGFNTSLDAVTRYGVTTAALQACIEKHDFKNRYSLNRIKEITKQCVEPKFQKRAIGRNMSFLGMETIAAACSKSILCNNGKDYLLLFNIPKIVLRMALQPLGVAYHVVKEYSATSDDAVCDAYQRKEGVTILVFPHEHIPRNLYERTFPYQCEIPDNVLHLEPA